MAKTKRQPFLADLHIKMPAALTDMVERAADQNMTTTSEYVRQAILARLKSENLPQHEAA